jgi:hypothetical protein
MKVRLSAALLVGSMVFGVGGTVGIVSTATNAGATTCTQSVLSSSTVYTASNDNSIYGKAFAGGDCSPIATWTKVEICGEASPDNAPGSFTIIQFPGGLLQCADDIRQCNCDFTQQTGKVYGIPNGYYRQRIIVWNYNSNGTLLKQTTFYRSLLHVG